MRPIALHLLLLAITVSTATPSQVDAQNKTSSLEHKLKRATGKSIQYKRFHQAAMKLMLADKHKESIELLQGFAKDNPDDAETHFMLAVVYGHQGDTESARASAQQAIDLGLPADRFVAGPRGLLPRVAVIRDILQQMTGQLVHGPMLGEVTDTSAKVWVRTAIPADVRVLVSTDPSFSESLTSGLVRSTSDSDYTAVCRVEGLKPETEYFYKVELDGTPLPHNPRQILTTTPAKGSPTKLRLAFGGGAGYVPQHERMWATIQSFEPQALLLLGDNVYSDDPELTEMQQYCYYRRQSQPDFRSLVAATPVYSIWDDHDFGTNDCFGGPEIDEPYWKPAVWKTYQQNWANPNYGSGEQPGCWYRTSIGDIDFIMLDCRYYREDPRSGDSPSMLGPVQLAWLKENLADCDGTFKVLCSSVPWDFRTKGGSKDTWNGYQDEREEIFSMIEENNIEGVVLMSADRHRSDAWQIERPDGYDLFEFNSSRLTNQHVHPEQKEAIFSYNKKQSFGLVEFDTTVEDPTAKYTIVSIDGEEIDSLTIRRSQLTGK